MEDALWADAMSLSPVITFEFIESYGNQIHPLSGCELDHVIDGGTERISKLSSNPV